MHNKRRPACQWIWTACWYAIFVVLLAVLLKIRAWDVNALSTVNFAELLQRLVLQGQVVLTLSKKVLRFFQMSVCLSVFGATGPQLATASSFTRFLDHTQRRTTVGETPLGEWSARHRDLYLTIHAKLITFKCPKFRRNSNPQAQHASGRRPSP
jgi:hypothetical protein